MRNETMNGFTEGLGLTVTEGNEQFGITSLQIVDWTGKSHDNILKDIRKEIKSLEEIGVVIFHESSYVNVQNKIQPCYKMDKDGVMQLAMKYDAKIRYNIIQKLKELDEQVKHLKNNVNEVTKIAISEDSQKQRVLELNKLNFSERMVRKSFYNCIDYDQYKELHTRFIEYIKPMDATTRLSKMGYAVLGMEQLRKNLFTNQSGRIGDVVNIDEDIKLMLRTIDKVNNKSLGGDKAAQTRNINTMNGNIKVIESELVEAKNKVADLETLLKNSLIYPTCDEFIKLNIHGISNNYLFERRDGGTFKTDTYKNWINRFPLVKMPVKEFWNVDWTQPVEIFLHYIALPYFDHMNCDKAIIDHIIQRVYKEDDNIVHKVHSERIGDCKDYVTGEIHFHIRNKIV